MTIPAAIYVLNCLLLFFSSIITGIDAVKITDVKVPPIVLNGSDPIVLDCDYNVQLKEDPVTAGLIVKWYYKDIQTPVYQWIAGEQPQAAGILQNRLNLSYKSSEDPVKVYKALQIVTPTTELTGEYRCLVTTFDSEDLSEGKRMTVYVPGRNMALFAPESSHDGKYKIVCSAEGVFPEPNMTLRARERVVEDGRQQIEVISKDGLFDITATMQMVDTGDTGPLTFDCFLRIPDADYSVQKSIVYYPMSNNSGNLGIVAASIGVLLIVVTEIVKVLA